VRAVVTDGHGDAGVLGMADIPRPEPAPGQLLIRVAATSVNRPDIVQRQGHYPPPPGESAILGLECAGTVEALGSGVKSHAVGDRVFALLGGGGYAEFAVANAAHALAVPTNLGLAEAACIAETYITAWLNLFGNAALADGESVLLHGGGGGVNTAAIQLVAALRPQSPILVTASPAKVDRVRALGAHSVIDYRATDFGPEVHRLTDGRGVDVILDHIGAAYFERNLTALAVDGRLVVIGIMQGSKATLNLGRLMIRRQRIIGSVLRSRPADEKSRIIEHFAAEVLPLFDKALLVPLIDSCFPLEGVAEAHRRMEDGAHFGKIVLTVSVP
jgi:putative PIG3 family NAD(P)H quinone oxidoreductase